MDSSHLPVHVPCCLPKEHSVYYTTPDTSFISSGLKTGDEEQETTVRHVSPRPFFRQLHTMRGRFPLGGPIPTATLPRGQEQRHLWRVQKRRQHGSARVRPGVRRLYGRREPRATKDERKGEEEAAHQMMTREDKRGREGKHKRTESCPQGPERVSCAWWELRARVGISGLFLHVLPDLSFSFSFINTLMPYPKLQLWH